MNRRSFFRCLSGLAALVVCPIKPMPKAQTGWQILGLDAFIGNTPFRPRYVTVVWNRCLNSNGTIKLTMGSK